MNQFQSPRKLKQVWKRMIQTLKERRRIKSLVYQEDETYNTIIHIYINKCFYLRAIKKLFILFNYISLQKIIFF